MFFFNGIKRAGQNDAETTVKEHPMGDPIGVGGEESGMSGDAFVQARQTGDYYFSQHFDLTQPIHMLDDALNEYYKALELRPDDSDLQGRVARVYCRLGKYEKARRYADRSLLINSEAPEALYVLGYLAYRAKNYDEAIDYLKRAITSGGLKTSRMRFCLSYSLREQADLKASPWQRLKGKVKAGLQTALGMATIGFEPEKIQIHYFLRLLPDLIALYQADNREEYGPAIDKVFGLIEKYPGCASLMNMLGDFYCKSGQMEDANFWYYRASHRDPVYENAYFGIVKVLEEQGKYVEAGEVYQKLLALSPNDPDIYCSLGNLSFLLEDYDGAVNHYTHALNLSNDKVWTSDLAQSLGNIYSEHLAQPEAAQMAYQMAIRLNPDNITNYIHLGVLYFDRGFYDNAKQIYRQALMLEPNNAQLHCNLAYLEWMDENIEPAIRQYERTIALDSFYDIPHNNLGVIYMDNLGDLSRAIDLLERAVHLNGNYALAFYNLGRAYGLVGRKYDAASCFSRAQQLNQFTRELDNDELEERLNNLFS